MTDESSVISEANITDHHIGKVRDDNIIETEVYTYMHIIILIIFAKSM